MALPDLLLVREHEPALFALMGAEKRVHLQAAQHTNHHAQMRTGSENRAVRHLHLKRQTGQIPRQSPHRGEHLTCQFYSQQQSVVALAPALYQGQISFVASALQLHPLEE